MAARIDTAEVVSFRLKVPRMELERLPHTAPGQDLQVTLTEEEGDLYLGPEHGDSFGRFRPIGAEAVLTELYLSKDAGGDFFLRVLGPLVVRFSGDLEIRLIWNVPERNQQGDHALVKITRGMTDYPGLGHVPLTEEEAQAGAGAEGTGTVRNQLRAGGEDLAGVESSEEREVRRLLEKARAEYQRYLDRRGSGK